MELPSSSWLVGSSLQHTTQSCEHQSKRPRASKMMSVKYFKCCEKERMRDTSVHQGEIDFKKHFIVECSPGTSSLVWYSKWVSGPAGSGLSSGSWMVVRPFPVHCSWRLTRISCDVDYIDTVLELLSIFKNGPWDFVLVPYLFKAPDFSFPVLEGIKQPRLLMVTKMFMNISEANFEQWCAHLQKLCASPSCLCFHGRVLSCFFVSFPLFLTIRLPCLHSLHCDCSASARLKKMSFLFLLHNTAIWFSHVEQNELQCREC